MQQKGSACPVGQNCRAIGEGGTDGGREGGGEGGQRESEERMGRSRAHGAPCANAQGKSTNTTLWGKGGDGAAPPHIVTTPSRRRVFSVGALQRRTRYIREQKSHSVSTGRPCGHSDRRDSQHFQGTGTSSSAKGSRYLTSVHDAAPRPEYFPASHCERQRGGGGKESITGKRHARGPRLAVLQDGSARLNVAQQREQSPRPGRPARRSASSIFSLCLSFLPSASPGASPNVGPSNEAKRHNGREAVAEKQTQTDTGSRARACTCTCTEAWRKKKGEKRKETVGNQWESAPRKCR